MSNKELIKAGCVVGGLIGLGILAYMILKEDEEKVEKALADPEGHREGNQVGKRKPTTGKKNPVMKVNREDDFEHDVNEDQEDINDLIEQLDEPVEQIDELVAEEVETDPLPFPEGDKFPLRLGSHGERVERLKVWLMRNYGLFGKITKSYDEKTEELVLKHLGVDSVDEKTYDKYKMGKHVTEQIIVR